MEMHFGYNVRESQLAVSSRAALNTEFDLVISLICIQLQLLSKPILKIKVKQSPECIKLIHPEPILSITISSFPSRAIGMSVSFYGSTGCRSPKMSGKN